MVIKAYDDLSDNSKLHKFKTDFIMEVLKGLQYISLTSLSIEEPLFFYVVYIGNALNSLTNPDGFKDPYEHSLLYSYPVLFLVLWGISFSNLGLMDWVVFLAICAVCIIEPIVVKYLFQKNEESSFCKLIIRLLGCFLEIGILLFINELSASTKYLVSCSLGYCALSACVQFYSVFVANEDQETVPISTPVDIKPVPELQPDPDLQDDVLPSSTV